MAFFRKDTKGDESSGDASMSMRLREESIARRESLLGRREDELSKREKALERRLKEIVKESEVIIDRMIEEREKDLNARAEQMDEQQSQLYTSQQRLTAWEMDLQKRTNQLDSPNKAPALSSAEQRQLIELKQQVADFQRRLAELEGRELRVAAESKALQMLSTELAKRKADLLVAEQTRQEQPVQSNYYEDSSSSVFDSVHEQHAEEAWDDDFLLEQRALSSKPVEDMPSSMDSSSALDDDGPSALDDDIAASVPTPTITHCPDNDIPRTHKSSIHNPREMSVLMADQMMLRGHTVGSNHATDDDDAIQH